MEKMVETVECWRVEVNFKAPNSFDHRNVRVAGGRREIFLAGMWAMDVRLSD
jgi:hypothetical protein